MTGGRRSGGKSTDAKRKKESRPTACRGTLARPGLLAGHYGGTVTVHGYCIVDGGPTQIKGNLVLTPGSAVNATYALNDLSGSGRSTLWVRGNIEVRKGATLLMGCEPNHQPCTDDPNAATGGTLRGRDLVDGSLIASWARGVVVHASRIKGDVRQTYGGGGLSCAVPTSGLFSLIHSRVYSDYEDNKIFGDLKIIDLRTCWFDALRNRVRGSLTYARSTLADRGGSVVVSNEVYRTLRCIGDDPVVQYGDTNGKPNKAKHVSGQCGFKRYQPRPAPGGPLTVISIKKT